MAAGNHNLGTIRGTIEIDYDGAGIVKAIRDTDKAKNAMGGVDKASSTVLSAFGKFGKGAIGVAAGVSALTHGVGLLAGVVSTLGPLLAAGFAAAPAVILSFASALVIAKVATAGVGDALAAAAEGGDKFDKALAKLSPEAQRFAKAYQQALPALQAVKTSIQDAFFKGTDKQIGTVVNRIASLGPQATGVAFALGQIAQNIVKTATSGQNIERLRLILSGVNAFLLKMKGALTPVINGFLSLASQASKFGGVVGGNLATALQSFGNWLGKLNLSDIFAKAEPIITGLLGTFKDLGTIVMSIFSIFTVNGGDALGVFSTLASQLADFLTSAQGQQALQALGTALQAISQGAGQVFLALLQALAPAIVALAPGVAELATQVSGVLVTAINLLNPLLQALAGFLSDNMSWIGPLAIAVGGLAAAYKVGAATAKAVSAAQALLNGSMLKGTATWLGNTAAVIANRVAAAAAAVAMGVVRVATLAWTGVQWLLNAALNANPIGLVVIAIALLVAGIILAWKHSETFRNIVLAVWNAIKTAISATVNWFQNTAWPIIKAVIDFIIGYYKFLWNLTKAIWTGIFNAVKAAISAIASVAKAIWSAIVASIKFYINLIKTVITTGINVAKAVWNSVLNAIKAAARAVWAGIVAVIKGAINTVKSIINGIKSVVTTVKNAFNSAKNAASSALSGLISLVRGLPGRVTGALGNLGSLLYNKGKDLVRGFINGIGNMIGAVRDKARSIVSAVTDFLPGSPAKEGPLSGKGYVLLRARRFMNDFAQGIDDGSQKPVAALIGTVNHVARATVPSGSTTRSGASSAPVPTTPAVAGTRTYLVAIGEKQFAEIVVDAITGEPVAVKKAADEGGRRSAWAGSGRK